MPGFIPGILKVGHTLQIVGFPNCMKANHKSSLTLYHNDREDPKSKGFFCFYKKLFILDTYA